MMIFRFIHILLLSVIETCGADEVVNEHRCEKGRFKIPNTLGMMIQGIRCDSTQLFLCKGADKEQHTFYTLDDTSELLKDEFKEFLKKCSEKITEMCKLEKETWMKLDYVEEQCNNCINDVDKKEADMVSIAMVKF